MFHPVGEAGDTLKKRGLEEVKGELKSERDQRE